MSLLPKMAIIYASGQGRTRLMAESIAEGAKTVSGIEILLKEVTYAVPDDVKDADAILLGGSTYNHKLIESMNSYMDSLDKLDLKGKLGLAFGSYGWSGEGVTTMVNRMNSLGINLIEPGISIKQIPNEKVIKEFFMLGVKIAQKIKEGRDSAKTRA